MPEKNESGRVKTNATKRLYNFLSAVERTNPNAATPLIDVISGALASNGEATKPSDFQIYRATATLIESSEAEIKRYLSDELEFYQRPFEHLWRFFSPRQAMAAWNVTRAGLREKHVTDVENTGQRLTTLVPELLLTAEDFSEVREELGKLFKEIATAHVSAETRTRLVERFRELEDALGRYHLHGAPGVKHAFETAVGTVFSDIRVRADLSRDERQGGTLSNSIKTVFLATVFILGAANTFHDADKNFGPVVQQLFLGAHGQGEAPDTHHKIESSPAPESTGQEAHLQKV